MTACNNSQYNNGEAWAYIEQRLDKIMMEDLPTLECILEYHFRNKEYVCLAILTKRALAEYLLQPNRKYLPDAFMQENLSKVDCFSTLGDVIISAVVCGTHFLLSEQCTRHSMTQTNIKFTTNTRWEFLMKHYGVDKMVITWPREMSVHSTLRLIMESLCAVILLDCGSMAEAARVISRLINPEDFPPERYGSCRIEVNRVFSEMNVNFLYRDVPNFGTEVSIHHAQELVVNNEVVGVGVAESKESAQEEAAHEYIIGGGMATFVAIRRAMKESTESISKEKRRGESNKEDYYTILAKFFKTTHAALKKKVSIVPFMIETEEGKGNRISRLLCYITHDKKVIAAFVSSSKRDGVSGCLKRLYGYLIRGEECIQAHAHESILNHQVVASILQAGGALTNIPVRNWEGVNQNIFSENNNNHPNNNNNQWGHNSSSGSQSNDTNNNSRRHDNNNNNNNNNNNSYKNDNNGNRYDNDQQPGRHPNNGGSNSTRRDEGHKENTNPGNNSRQEGEEQRNHENGPSNAGNYTINLEELD